MSVIIQKWNWNNGAHSILPSPLLGVATPTTTWIKAITVTSTQQQNNSDRQSLSTQHSCCRTQCFFFCLQSRYRAGIGAFRIGRGDRWLVSGGLHCTTWPGLALPTSSTSLGQSSHFSRRPRHSLVFPPLCRRPSATTKPWNPIPRCLSTEVTLPSPAGDAANGRSKQLKAATSKQSASD